MYSANILKGLLVCVIVIVEGQHGFKKKLEKTVLDPTHCMLYFLGAKLVKRPCLSWTNLNQT